MTMKSTRSDNPRRRHGGSRPLLLVAVVVFLLSLVGVFWLTGSGDSEGDVVLDEIHTVERGSFTVSFPASGELSSSEFVEIRNPLDTVGVVKSIVDEGTTVQEGDTLIQFNEESLEDAIEKLEDQLTDAKNRVVDVEQNLEIGNSTRASALDKANINIEIAELGLKAWEEGVDLQNLQKYQLALETALINSTRLEKR
ncbi:MAG: hypothetical protein VYD99_06395, partial [Planctomycetota bacterium]|nr:hypothetical protein [Planctomycetota bacterium]